jgi:hypothetical protein
VPETPDFDLPAPDAPPVEMDFGLPVQDLPPERSTAW